MQSSLYLDRTLEAKAPSRPISTRKSPQPRPKTRTRFFWVPRAASLSALVTKKHKLLSRYLRTPPGVRAATPPYPWSLLPKEFPRFLYSLLKSAASAVLKTHVCGDCYRTCFCFVSMKSLSVSTMLLEYSFGKLKYDSTTLPMSGFLRFLRLFSASKFSCFSCYSQFFYYQVFQCGVSPTPTPPGQKYPSASPVDRIPGIKSRLEAGMRSCPSWGSPGRDHLVRS